MSFFSRIFGGQEADGLNLSPSDFMERRMQDDPVLDVRTPVEFASGHITDAINVDINAPDFSKQVTNLIAKGTISTDQPVYLYCRSGNRSGKAARVLRQMGFEQSYNIGGFAALKAAGVPSKG